MILARAKISGAIVAVVVEGDTLREVRSTLEFPCQFTGRTFPSAGVAFASPVTPGKIVCVGRNYRAHAKELGNEMPAEPLLFIKPTSAMVGPGDVIELPPESDRVEHEGELAVVI